ncbi:hypothetical protein LX32DRAFT_425688 [Colletotrichum zoysiae]|uniref:Uncharacterized protein n=1 Tax=Colletotrichum zoysiae TaxID=1216348 RepID=A0AAD9HFN0_9PEZI|nr:hypothetical protein LX32DRAFT_425688 [Colletotrichum zoysiae]
MSVLCQPYLLFAVVSWLPSQNDPNADTFVTFDDCPTCHITFQLGTYAFTSQDDRSLGITYYGRLLGCVAILEAKRTMGRPVDGTRLLSDDCPRQVVVTGASPLNCQSGATFVAHRRPELSQRSY